MPVVEVVELGVDAVVVLEVCAVGQVWLKGEAKAVLTEMLHVVLNGDLDDLAWGSRGQVRSERGYWWVSGLGCNEVKWLD